jgi:hypothetical protein
MTSDQSGSQNREANGYIYSVYFREEITEEVNQWVRTINPIIGYDRVAVGHDIAKFDLDVVATSGVPLGVGLAVPSTMPPSGNLKNSQMVFFLDESLNDLWVLAKKSNGVVVSGKIADLS